MKALALSLIGLYQRTLSVWLTAWFGPMCRFEPSCSRYTAMAITKHGLACGAAMGAWRICRCNPLVQGGFDPVPEHCPRPMKA